MGTIWKKILAINVLVKENCITVLQNEYDKKCPWSKLANVNGVMNWLCWWFLKFLMESRVWKKCINPPSLKVDHYQLYTRCNLVCLFVCRYIAHPFSSLPLVWLLWCVCVQGHVWRFHLGGVTTVNAKFKMYLSLWQKPKRACFCFVLCSLTHVAVQGVKTFAWQMT